MPSSNASLLIYEQENDNNDFKSEYKVDLWCEFKKRWVVCGALAAVGIAVLAPKYGASGGKFKACTLSLAKCTIRSYPTGILHTEYSSCLPLSWIYFNAGLLPFQPLRARVYTLTAFHANIASVILCAVTVNALTVALDRRVMEGAILASSSGPCGWLSLSLYANGSTPLLVGCNYALSLLTIPLTHLLLCGNVPVPSMEDLKTAAVTAVLPFLVGICATSKSLSSRTSSKVAALLLLYVDCCNLLREAEGALYVSDVLATLVLVASWLSTVAAASYLYVKCGFLDVHEAQLLLLVATPKSTFDWISTACPREGLHQLPTVFLAPAQALLLSSLFFETDLSKSPT